MEKWNGADADFASIERTLASRAAEAAAVAVLLPGRRISDMYCAIATVFAARANDARLAGNLQDMEVWTTEKRACDLSAVAADKRAAERRARGGE